MNPAVLNDKHATSRESKVLLGSAAGVIARGVSILVSIVSVPLTYKHLDKESFGVWIIITSLGILFSFSDLGLGNGLISKATKSHALSDHKLTRTYFSTAICFLALIAVSGATILNLAFPHVPWERFYGLENSPITSESGTATAIFLFGILVQLPLSAVSKLQVAMQRTHVPAIWTTIGSLLGLAGLWLAVELNLSLAWIVGSTIAGSVLASLINSIIFICRNEFALRPRINLFQANTAKELLQIGWKFVLLQAIASALYSIDALLISRQLGAGAVAEFAIPQRLFGLATAIAIALLAPLWPAYGDALAKRDRLWIQKALIRSLAISTTFMAICGSVLVFFGESIASMWLGKSIVFDLSLMIALATSKIIETAAGAISLFLNANESLWIQIAVGSLTLLIATALKSVLIAHLGVSGAPWGTTIALIICAVVPYYLYIRKL